MIKTSAIFLFLNYCLGKKVDMSMVVTNLDWRQLYTFASRQAVLGFCFDGIERLTKEFSEELKQNPMGRDLLMTWMGKAQQIHRQNMKVNAVAGKLYSKFREDGLRCCILKGQGNALMYPNAYSRNPGDIDIWVEGGDKRVISFVRSISPHEKACYHHIEFPSYKGVEVEVHYRPSFLLCFWHNRKLQKYYERVKEEQFSHRVMLGEQGEVAIPTVEFNLIFQLTHIYAHLMNEGIGLRQLVDYYYVLCDFYKVYQNSSKTHPSSLTLKGGSTAFPKPLSPQGTGDVTAPPRRSEPLRSKVGGPSKVSPDCAGWDRLSIEGDNSASSTTAVTSSASTALDVVRKELKELGLWKFAGGIMYIMQEVFGMPASRLIVPPNEKYGKFVLNEVLEAGNFGRHDARNRFGRSKFGHNLQRVYRDIRLVRYFPAEALCEPLFRTWHFFWRMKNKK